ncbi:hypothetical protein [Anaerocolumna sp. AGMB13020]|uniref:hypothetical protein n=1 Tax=Anaerocolumna sp. AGMB13020 TaxID=3081750 RepID=UPI003FA4593E
MIDYFLYFLYNLNVIKRNLTLILLPICYISNSCLLRRYYNGRINSLFQNPKQYYTNTKEIGYAFRRSWFINK